MNLRLFLPAVSLLTLSYFHGVGQAAESDKFPSTIALKDSFKTYISTSENSLTYLDAQMASGKPIGNNWKSECDGVLRVLIQSKVDALNTYHKRGGHGPLPAPVQTWFANENAAWVNIIKIGAELTGYHNEVMSQTGNINLIILPGFRKQLGWVKVLAEPANKIMSDLIGMPDSGDSSQEKIDNLTKAAITDVTKLVTGLGQVNEGVKANKRKLDEGPYRSRLTALKQKRVDPDQAGVFYEHEKLWEGSLSAALAEYDKAYNNYVREVTEVETLEILKPYANLVGLPTSATAVRAWVSSKVPKFMHGKGSVKFAGWALVRDMTVGRPYFFRVNVQNDGKRAFGKGELKLVCTVSASPKGYNVREGSLAYTETNTDPVLVGKVYPFNTHFEAPPGVGEWTLKWQLFDGTKVLDTKEDTVNIIGSMEARLERSTFPREMKIGREYKVEVTIVNSGQTPLTKNDVTLVCNNYRPPNGYRAQDKDFFFSLKPDDVIAPGDSYKFTTYLKPAAAEGDWQLELMLIVNRKTMSRRDKVYLKVVP